MKKLLCALIALPASAFAVDYDINKYCRQVGDMSGGSAQMELMCRELEGQARYNVAAKNPPKKVMDYCLKVGNAAGGSYTMLESCIDQEMQARAKLR